jgi:alpha-L-rhamnosidase
LLLLILALVAIQSSVECEESSPVLHAKGLRCEYLQSPRGIDTPKPCLSWLLETTPPDSPGVTQSAYRVLVASSTESLAKDQGDLWDSGTVKSGQTLQIEYAGKPLRSNQHCWWKVSIWDGKGATAGWSEPSIWSMGLLSPTDWHGKWISSPTSGATANTPQPLPIFRREFQVERKVRRASVSVCGLGHYVLRINGQRIGDRAIDPGWTNYKKSCLYSTYDVTNNLQVGSNAMGILLGNGMYHVVGGRYVKGLWSFGGPKVILQLHIDYVDGGTAEVVTDGNWKCMDGPIRFSCVYGGEDYDARVEQAGWDSSGFTESPVWLPAVVTDGPGGILKAQMNEPVKVVDQLHPIAPPVQSGEGWLYDFGQNASGWVKVMLRGSAGSMVRITPVESLKDGKIDQSQSGTPVWWQYTLRGEGLEEWAPRFHYYGFRWVLVEGATPAGQGSNSGPILDNIESQVLATGVEQTGTFTCSNELLNKIHHIIKWAILSNMKSVLTDCPHREKLGWLEEAHLVGPGVMDNYGVTSLYRKIANDMAEAQLENGLVPDTAPEYTVFDAGFRDSPEWGGAFILATWQSYQRYGDRQSLEKHFDAMKRYVDYLQSKSQEGIVSHGLGDWYDLGPNPPGPSQLTPFGITATAIFYECVRDLERIAGILGRTEDATRLGELGAKIKESFNKQFHNLETHQYGTGSQTSNAMPLVVGLVPEDHKAAVLENLIQDIRTHGNHTTAGDVGHRYVLRALAQAGRSDVIYDMASREDHPSYGYQIKSGATTLTEAWNGPTAGYSQNHFMLGHIQEWFYQDLTGIRLDFSLPADERLTLSPQPVPGLDSAEATYDSVLGMITSKWRRERPAIHFECSIPTGVTATIILPIQPPAAIYSNGGPVWMDPGIRIVKQEGERFVLKAGPGKHTFSVVSTAESSGEAAPTAPETDIDPATLDQWAQPFRNWHYYPDYVIPPSPADGLGFQMVDTPLVWQKGDEWRMWYTGFDGKGYQTALAVSKDLVHWEPKGLTMGYGKEGAFDHGGLSFGGPLFESYDLKAPRTLKKWNGKYWVLYGCYPKQGGYEIRPGAEGLAWSEDGETWHRASEDRPILSIEGAADWEKDCIYEPWLVEHDGKFYDFYNAANGSIEQMGFAVSTDLVNWTRHPDNPVVRNRPGGYDEQFCSDGKVFRDGDHWVMIYFGVGHDGAHIMVAFSRDLVHWFSHPEPLYKAGGNPSGLDKQYAHKVSLVYRPENDTFYLYYCAVGPKGRGIGLITSKPLE